MNPAALSAFAALAGSAIGGSASFISSWLSQGTQLRAQLFLHDKGHREELYREFIEAASESYIDALTRSTPDLPKAIRLYALISRMRVLSTPEVIEKAEKIVRLIIDAYAEPNKTFEELRSMMRESALDPLRDFSEACRNELQPRGYKTPLGKSR